MPVIQWILSMNKEWYVSLLVFIEITFVLPSTVIALFTNQLNFIANTAVQRTNKQFPKLIGHWKNPMYHFYIIVNMFILAIFYPIYLLLNLIDGK